MGAMQSGRLHYEHRERCQRNVQDSLHCVSERAYRPGDGEREPTTKTNTELRTGCSVYGTRMRKSTNRSWFVQRTLSTMAIRKGSWDFDSRSRRWKGDTSLRLCNMQSSRLYGETSQSVDVRKACTATRSWDHRRSGEPASRTKSRSKTLGLEKGARRIHSGQGSRRTSRCTARRLDLRASARHGETPRTTARAR